MKKLRLFTNIETANVTAKIIIITKCPNMNEERETST